MAGLQHQAKILEHREVAPRHYRLRLAAPEVAWSAQAGQFVHILPRDGHTCDPLLRRAFSILSLNSNGIEVLFRIEGKGTTLMAEWTVGHVVDLLGPLGLPFAPMPANVLLVGGGVGVPPMAMLASQRHQAPHDGQNMVALLGARAAAEVICRDDFARYDVPVEIATDDGSLGHHGFVTDLLTRKLKSVSAPPTVYACGPLPMLRAVARLCDTYNAPCQISLEENMPCGIGVCNGCVVPVHGAGDDYGSYRRICVDGPVLWAHEVNF